MLNNIGNNNTIHIIDGLCGSRKTSLMLDTMLKNQDSKYLYASITKVLSEQIYSNLDNPINNLNRMEYISRCDSDNRDISVNKNIEKTLISHNALNDNGGAVLITHSALFTCAFNHLTADWQLILDEIPTIDKLFELKFNSTNIDKLLKYIRINPDFKHNTLYEVVANYVIDTLKDSIDEIFFPLIKEMECGSKAFVEINCWNKYVVERNADTAEDKTIRDDDKNKIYIVTMKSPQMIVGFESVRMMGAHFTHSILYKWWTEQYGIKFVNDSIQNKLLYQEHINGSRLKIIWLSEHNWSKTYRNQDDVDFGTVGKKLFSMAKEKLNGKYLLISNSDDQPEEIDTELFSSIGCVSHGLNKHDDKDYIYFNCSLNKKPAHSRILNALGFDDKFLKRACYLEVAYQNLLRTSMRDPLATNDVVLVVNDKWLAVNLASMFKGCSIEAHEKAIMGKVAKTKTERNEAYYSKKAVKKVAMSPAEKQAKYRAKIAAKKAK